MLSVRRVIFWQAAAVVCAIALAVAVSRFFPVVSFIEGLQARVISWGGWAGVCYPLLFAACSILLLPGGILAVGGGFFFGLWWGFSVVLAGNIVATAISFALSRFVARRWFRRKLSRNPILKALGPAVERESWKIILLSQLHPLFPTSLLNYFYGVTRIRFSTYMLWATIGRAPGLFLLLYRYSGATRSADHARQKLPAHARILDLGWRIHNNRVAFGGLGPRSISCYSSLTERGCQRNINRCARASHII